MKLSWHDIYHHVYSEGWKALLQTTTCVTEDAKHSTLFYCTTPFNSSWETKNLGCGVLGIWCHTGGSLRKVLPELGCPQNKQGAVYCQPLTHRSPRGHSGQLFMSSCHGGVLYTIPLYRTFHTIGRQYKEMFWNKQDMKINLSWKFGT